MTDAQELKPCPFCGSDELSHGWSAPGCDGSMSTGNVECHNCNALIYSQQGECDAIAAWNTRASPVDANKPTPTAVADSAAADSVVNGDLVEAVARAIAASDGLDFGEFCGVDADPDDGYCDSSTCVAAHWEEHDAEQARRWYLHLARAALATAAPLIRTQRDAEIAAWLREHAPQWGHEALADAIERGEVAHAE